MWVGKEKFGRSLLSMERVSVVNFADQRRSSRWSCHSTSPISSRGTRDKVTKKEDGRFVFTPGECLNRSPFYLNFNVMTTTYQSSWAPKVAHISNSLTNSSVMLHNSLAKSGFRAISELFPNFPGGSKYAALYPSALFRISAEEAANATVRAACGASENQRNNKLYSPRTMKFQLSNSFSVRSIAQVGEKCERNRNFVEIPVRTAPGFRQIARIGMFSSVNLLCNSFVNKIPQSLLNAKTRSTKQW